MKKIFAFILAVLMLCALCACAGESAATPSEPAAPAEPAAPSEPAAPAGPESGTPLASFYEAVLAAQSGDKEELIFFEESNPDLIASFYPGLEAIELSQQAFYMPPIATHPCEIVLVEVKNSSDVDAVADIFQARIDLGSDNDTYPESAEGWMKYAQVQKSGNFVCMIVLPEGYTIPENVFAS